MAELEEELQSFTSDDELVLKYLDTARLQTSNDEDGKKPYLILVRTSFHRFRYIHYMLLIP